MCELNKVKKAMAGNKIAFQELVLQEKDNLYRMAYIYMKNENDALDVVHESVFKAYKSIKKLKEPSYFSTWLTRIIINTSIDFLKKKNLYDVVPVDYEEVQGDINHAKVEERLDLLHAINQLEERFKTLILLRYYKDLSIKEIARDFNCPEGTIKAQLHRATTKLRMNLKEGTVYEEDPKRNGTN
ncbi:MULTISPECIES: sigma-70 family RNA polymerase sigma factor [unclassified Peribacillus]|uniref:sigma-70 family RNA polymerase sigma factor n=1 Tax=unclassified Peribacillus TaxID=2675266 RepID=UPI0036732C73